MVVIAIGQETCSSSTYSPLDLYPHKKSSLSKDSRGMSYYTNSKWDENLERHKRLDIEVSDVTFTIALPIIEVVDPLGKVTWEGKKVWKEDRIHM